MLRDGQVLVLARLEKEGLKPMPEASRETLIRRLSLDLIAERIRSLGHYAPFGNSIATKSSIKGDTGVPSEDEMLANLAAGNEAVVKAARSALNIAEEAGDQATADLMTQRVSVGEKAAWMLRAHLAK